MRKIGRASPFSRITIPRIEVEHARGLFWTGTEDILFYPKNSRIAKILNIATGKIREAAEDVRGCKGGEDIYQANPYSRVEKDEQLRSLQNSPCAIAMFPPSHDQATYWASFSLLAADGYVTLPLASGDAVLHKPDQTSTTLTGLNSVKLYGVSQHVVFYPFKGAYLLHHAQPKEITWLYPGGKLETVELKDAIAPGGNSLIYATKTGFIQTYYLWPKWGSVLLGSGVVHLERNPVWRVAVHPEGCKVAYSYTEEIKTNAELLNLIDVCE
jgi:hypothetical protein